MSKNAENDDRVTIVFIPAEQTEKFLKAMLGSDTNGDLARFILTPLTHPQLPVVESSATVEQAQSSSEAMAPMAQASSRQEASALDIAVEEEEGGEEKLLKEQQLADRWGVSVKKLQADRFTGRGCKFLKLGRNVRYRLSDIRGFEEESLQANTSQEF